MSSKHRCVVAAISAALAIALWPWAGGASPQVMTPFKARLHGFADPVFNPDGTIANTETAEGQATHLGRFSWVSEELAVFTGPNQLHVEGTFTMTAANGDQVFGTYQTVGTVDFPTGVLVGPYTVTGGTGRFANVTGTGTIVGIGNLLPPFEIVGRLTGEISPGGH